MKKLTHIIDLLNKNPTISIFRFFTFSFDNKIQDKLKDLTPSERSTLQKCIGLKENSSRSFWEVFFTMTKEERIIEGRILGHATFHNENALYKHIYAKDIVNFISNTDSENVALNSKVTLKDGTCMHIPMLDFKIDSNSKNLSIVKAILAELKLEGSILDSGKSFHFIGNELIAESQLIDLLAKFILFHPISDKAWATHQIIERSASLRVSRKYGERPILMAMT